MSRVRWGLLSTAGIGRVVVAATRGAKRAAFVAVASRDGAKARRFADEVGLANSYGSYEEMLARDDVDAVYVALPISLHTEWTIAALRAGKHVLCEKPFAVTATAAASCFDAAEAAGRICVEGFMYRHHPQTVLTRRLISGGAIGRPALLRSSLTVTVPPGDIRRSASLAGGALLDLGCYCVSASRLLGGTPERVFAEQAADTVADRSGRPVDLRITGALRMPGDVLAQFDAGLDLPRRDELEIVGTEGRITVPDPWLCCRGFVELTDADGTRRVPVGDPDPYGIEFETVSAAIADGSELEFGRRDAVEQAATLEALRRSAEQGQAVDVAPF
jgi:predicted dehydrogenase